MDSSLACSAWKIRIRTGWLMTAKFLRGMEFAIVIDFCIVIKNNNEKITFVNSCHVNKLLNPLLDRDSISFCHPSQPEQPIAKVHDKEGEEAVLTIDPGKAMT